MQVLGPNELLEHVVKRDLCIGCGACVELCPYFRNHRGKTSMLFPCTLTRGRCFAYCPKVEVDLDEISSGLTGVPYPGSPLGNCLEVVASKAGPRAVKGDFQAGGTVSSLIALALKAHLIDGAVLTDRKGLAPVPRLVRRPSEVKACASSKYMASPTLAAFNRACREGATRLGVVGTPCQVTALAQMRLNPLAEEDFLPPAELVVGLFCTWALDARKLEAFLADRIEVGRIHGMDMTPPPEAVMVVDLGQDKLEIPLEEVRPMVPSGCLVCPDMTSEWADLSVGVLEGEPEWNTLIVRTQKGQALVEQASRKGYLVTREMPRENLEHLAEAASNKKKRALIRAGEEGILNSAANGRRAALRINSAAVVRIKGCHIGHSGAGSIRFEGSAGSMAPRSRCDAGAAARGISLPAQAVWWRITFPGRQLLKICREERRRRHVVPD